MFQNGPIFGANFDFEKNLLSKMHGQYAILIDYEDDADQGRNVLNTIFIHRKDLTKILDKLS